MNEAHTTKYSVHPGAGKMYYDLRDLYWWPEMKKDISIIIWKEVSPRKGVVRFGKRSKISLRYVGPFKVVERVGPGAYRLRLPQELVDIQDIFHMSNLKKCLADVNLHVPLEEVKIDDKLHFVEEPMEIMDREVKKLKKSRIPIVTFLREIEDLLLRPQQIIIGGTLNQTSIVTDHPRKNMVDRGIFDSGCSGHMTCTKDQVEDFEEFYGGSVTFGGSKGYISSKGKIRPDGKIKILLKVPRHTIWGGVQFDMKTSPAKGFACLIAKATFDESKLWHRRLKKLLIIRVKSFRSDNGTEFKNRDMLEFCGNKGIKQEYSNARTPQQNGVAERMNMTLIEAARTMLADSLLPTTFWAEAVSTACYIFNRLYRLLGVMFTILDTLSVLGKFDGKSDEGFLVGYSLNSKAYRVYNLVTKRVEVNLHVNFLEDKPNVKGVGYRWMFEYVLSTDLMNYIPVSLENQANPHAGASEVTNSAEKKASSTDTSEDNPKILAFRRELEEIALKHLGKVSENTTTSTSLVNTGSEPVNTGSFDPCDSTYCQSSNLSLSLRLGIFNEGILWMTREEPKKIFEALQDDSWVQAMQEELLQFKLQQVWVLIDLPHRMKFMMIQEFCPSNEMQKLESELWNHAMVGAGHAAYIDRFHKLARLVPHLVTPKSRMIERYVYGHTTQIREMVAAMELKTIQKAVQISGALTDEAVRNGSIKKVEKRGNIGEPSKDKNGRDDNKRTRTGNDFATTVNPVGRENTGTWPKCTICNSYHAPGGPCRTCFNCNRPGHLAKDCRGVPRYVNPVNARNPTIRACYVCGSTDHVRSACPRLNRAQGPEENRLNQVAANNGGQGHGNQGN
ncbi:reverse transcriptase domain-containing protein [Tanacetum coccineum]